MVVVADAISNRTVVAVAPGEGQALVAGDDAAFTVDPRDQYDNRLDSQDQQVLNQVNLVVDTFRVDQDLGNPKMLGLQVLFACTVAPPREHEPAAERPRFPALENHV